MEPQSSDSLDIDHLIACLGGDEELSASARATRAFLRAREIKTARDLLRLTLMYGPGGLSLRAAAAVAAGSGIADISDVALLKRIGGAASWLELLCAKLLNLAVGGEPHPPQQAAEPTGWSGAISLVDASVIKAPGQAANYRLHLRWNARSQCIADARFTPIKAGERLDLLATEPGTLIIADRGYPQPDGLRNTLDRGAHVLVRITWNSLKLKDQDGHPLDWLALCDRARGAGLEMAVTVHKSRGRFQPIPMRLVMIPKPPEGADRGRRKAKRASVKDQRKTIDPRTLACAGFLIVLTSLPQSVTTNEILTLYRLRWQVELVFKRLKSLLHLDRLPARDPDLARAWLHAHLLVALIAEHLIAQADALPP